MTTSPRDTTLPATAVPGPPPFLRWAPLLVVAVAWFAHEGARNHTWVLEDVGIVRDDPDVARGPAGVPDLLAAGWRGSETASGPYGPLTRATFALETPFWRRADGTATPGGYHLVNLLLHGLCALLFFRVLLGLLPGRGGVALAAALCFAAHPLHVATVGTLMGRAELLAALFCLLATLAWRAFGPGRPGWLVLAMLAWSLALLSKEVALGLPLALFLLDRIRPAPAQVGAGARGLLIARAAFVLVPLGVFLLSGGGAGSAAAGLPVQGLGARLAAGLDGWGRMLLLLALPVGLRGDHTDEAAPGVGYALHAGGWVLVALVGLVSLVLVLRAVRGRAGIGAALWALGLSLAVPAALAAPAGAAYESRFAYLTALPLLVVAGLLVEALGPRRGEQTAFALGRAILVGFVALACLVGLSQREGLAWRDDETFHDRLLQRDPTHVRAMTRLARLQRLSAQELRLRASGLPADSPQREALLAQRRDALVRALSWAQRATRHDLGRGDTEAWREYGFALLSADRSADALTALARARELDPVLQRPPAEVRAGFPAERRAAAAEVYHAIGRAQEAQGQREPAADAFLSAARLDEKRPDYLERAGLALCRVGRYGEGLALLRDLERRAPTPAERERLGGVIEDAVRTARQLAQDLLRDGQSASERGDHADAVRLFERVIEVDPSSVEAFVQAGWLRGWYFGSYEQAFRYLDRAEELLSARVVAADDPTWKRIDGYRRRLEDQKREEEAEEAREDR